MNLASFNNSLTTASLLKADKPLVASKPEGFLEANRLSTFNSKSYFLKNQALQIEVA